MKPYWGALFLAAFFIQTYTMDADAVTATDCKAENKVLLGDTCESQCPAGYFAHNSECKSCSDATGEANATSAAGSVGMQSCYLPLKDDKNNQNTYTDEKGSFVYESNSNCFVKCASNTQYLCTSA
ncbi:MAG: hypothetical protein IKZ34_01095 [Alphaproteobacteria bacterium]|nr:hypothetical protein [Alphaproteobacteria bacterium]